MRFPVLLAALLVGACAHAGPADPGPPSPVIEYVRQQEILTPLPLRVRLPAATHTEHVVVLFKTWGSRGWREMELARDGQSQTWNGEVSCREVSTVTGDTKYFFLALDDQGELVGGSGSPDWPHVATIVGKLPNGAETLPGGSTPMRCHDPADCPPDFPGCPAYSIKRNACRSDRDCARGSTCAWDGYCGAADVDPRVLVEGSDEDQLEAAVRSVRGRFRRMAGKPSPTL